MNKVLTQFILIFLLSGCAPLGELASNTIAGALGNMLDRRVEGQLGNDAVKADEELENKYEKLKQSEAPKTKPNAACVSSLSRNP